MEEIYASKIKNIIFDLGGVLLNINPILSLMEFGKISGIDTKELESKLLNENVFQKLETGSLNPQQFRQALCRIMNFTMGDDEIDRAWNMLLLDFPVNRVALLKEIQKNYRVFLLSNTNILHYWHYTNCFHEQYEIQMSDLFEKMFLSYEIGLHKPDPAIYKFVLDHANIHNAETVFIDDSLQNILAAQQMGIGGIHIQNSDVVDYFEEGYLKPLK